MRRTDCSEILKALSEPSRLRLVKTLLRRSLSVNELADALAISQYHVSKHLRVLRHAGIVQPHANGQRREYDIPPKIRARIAGPRLDFGCCTFRFDRIEA